MSREIDTLIAAALADCGVPHERIGAASWRVDLPATDRRSITAGMAIGERTLWFDAFLLRRPDRDHEAVYGRLLAKNYDLRTTGPWRFAIDEYGDLRLVAETPLAGLDQERIDRLLGALCALVDATWAGLVELGFELPTPVREN